MFTVRRSYRGQRDPPPAPSQRPVHVWPQVGINHGRRIRMGFKHACSAIALVGAASLPLAAAGQESKVKNETKLEVKDGKDVTLTGCLERHPDSTASTGATGATQYQLTQVADKKNELHSYLLVGEEGDLKDHVG